jgi:hypothetical protein
MGTRRNMQGNPSEMEVFSGEIIYEWWTFHQAMFWVMDRPKNCGVA